MKKIILITSLLISFHTINSQNIEGKITYLATSKNALNNVLSSTKTKKSKHVINMYKNAKDVEVVLKFNKEIAEYYVINKMKVNDKDFNFTYMIAGSNNIYYTYHTFKGYESKNLNCTLLGECVLIEEQLPKWILKQDTKIIQGFTCYKAILKNPKTGILNLEAWYTPEIPYQYGVINYYGLPGTILEINRNTFTITAKKIEINPLEKITIKEPSKDIKTLTNKEIKELLYRNSPFN